MATPKEPSRSTGPCSGANFSAVLEAEQCGWLKDKFGVSWQIVPTALAKLLCDPDPEASQRVTRAMLEMKKLDIAALERARAQRQKSPS